MLVTFKLTIFLQEESSLIWDYTVCIDGLSENLGSLW